MTKERGGKAEDEEKSKEEVEENLGVETVQACNTENYNGKFPIDRIPKHRQPPLFSHFP